MAEGSLFAEGLFVLLMPDALFHDILFHTLCLLDVSTACLQDRVHLRAQAVVFGNGAPSTLVLHLPQHFFVGGAVQWVIRWVIRGVIELWMFGHVFVDVLHLDLEEETVGVGAAELTPVPVLFPELVCLFVLRFYGPVNPMGSCRARSVYLTTHLLGRLSPLSGLPVLCTFFRQKLTTALLESAEGRE